MIHLLVPSSNACSIQGWAKQKPGARNCLGIGIHLPAWSQSQNLNPGVLTSVLQPMYRNLQLSISKIVDHFQKKNSFLHCSLNSSMCSSILPSVSNRNSALKCFFLSKSQLFPHTLQFLFDAERRFGVGNLLLSRYTFMLKECLQFQQPVFPTELLPLRSRVRH